MAHRKKRAVAIPPAKSEPRRHRGRVREEAAFPAAPTRSKLPRDYEDALGTIKRRIRDERLRVVVAANAAMVRLYWDIGHMILERQEHAGWGAKVIDRLAADLRYAFPDLKGFSPRNLKYMRAFAAAWPEGAIVQEALAQIPWYHHIALLEKCRTPEERLWYARQSAAQGWSHSILSLQIESRAHERQGKAISNFRDTLPPVESDLAAQVFKDPYLFDFLGTADPRREREIEQALVDHIQRFLLELGAGFAFVSRQVPLEVGDRDFQIDLLFYHLNLRCYVVVELKAVPFDPAFVGQLNLYLSAADDQPPSGCFCAARRTSSSSSMRCGISSARSASPAGKRDSSRSCRRHSREACRRWRRSRRSCRASCGGRRGRAGGSREAIRSREGGCRDCRQPEGARV